MIERGNLVRVCSICNMSTAALLTISLAFAKRMEHFQFVQASLEHLIDSTLFLKVVFQAFQIIRGRKKERLRKVFKVRWKMME